MAAGLSMNGASEWATDSGREAGSWFPSLGELDEDKMGQEMGSAGPDAWI